MLSPQAADQVGEAVDEPRDRERRRAELVAAILALLLLYRGQVYAEIGIEAPKDATPAEIGWATRRARDLLDQVNATTQRQVRAALAAGMAAGESADALAERVTTVFADAERLRAPLIGDTTATEIGGFAAFNTALHTGLQRIIWSTMRDDRVRDSHAPMDGQAKHPGEIFTSGAGNQAYYPGAFGVASEDCGCRCWLEIETSAKAAPARRPELEAIREATRQMIAQTLAGTMVAIFRDQRGRVLAALRRLDV